MTGLTRSSLKKVLLVPETEGFIFRGKKLEANFLFAKEYKHSEL